MPDDVTFPCLECSKPTRPEDGVPLFADPAASEVAGFLCLDCYLAVLFAEQAATGDSTSGGEATAPE